MALMAHRTEMCAAEPATGCVPARTASGEMEASRTVSTPSATAATAFREREVISDAY